MTFTVSLIFPSIFPQTIVLTANEHTLASDVNIEVLSLQLAESEVIAHSLQLNRDS